MFPKKAGVLTVTTSYTSNSASTTVELKPSYNIPLVLVIVAIPLFLVQPWVAGVFALLGLFLMFQTVTLRLFFTPTDLDIYRGEKLIRRFPYREWQNWRIFWNPMPILFYFKEVKSIHFLPILFDPNTLKACLEERCPQI
ncbi:glycerol dehydrogenase [Nostocales cyanobacterium HT-58-2]|nr:glycerol dehydrogenase [Nostocales cyanobacterium HT-58-2]